MQIFGEYIRNRIFIHEYILYTDLGLNLRSLTFFSDNLFSLYGFYIK